MDVHSIVGRHAGRAKPEVKAGLRIDTEAVKKLDKELAAVKKTVTALADELQRAADASGQLSGNASSTGPRAQNGMPMGRNTSPGAAGGAAGAAGGGMLSRFGGGAGGGGILSQLGGAFGGGRGLGGFLAGAAGAGYIGAQVTRAVDSRVDRNRAYALTADRLGVETQLRTGMSQMQYMRYRQQIVGDRNADNVNVDPTALIGFENRTGISAAQQRRSVGAVRTLSGYSMGTQDVLNVMQQNLNPAVANRQFMMMGGLSMYGAGGEPRDYMSLMNARVKMFGLDNRMISKGALREGSISRNRMNMAGVTQDEQDLLIQLGQAQSTFREKGGKGSFDPTNKQHRDIAGVEDNFATQFDETERTRAVREEDMMRRQIDNYADLEKSNQKIIQHLSNIEDTLSGAIGARTSNRNLMNFSGRVMQGIGAGLLLTGVGTGVGAGMLAAGTVISGAGDPPEVGVSSSGAMGASSSSSSVNDDKIMVPFGYKGNGPGPRRPLSEVKQSGIFSNLKPQMQDRLLRMMRENPDVGIGGGYRDTKQQEAEFLRRHVVTTEGDHDRVWNGKYWKLVKGAPYAPPGSSMHEIGLAADLVGDLDWMNKNAGRFGLKHFAGVNGEPWHVQPLEFPNSRREYEASGGISSYAPPGGEVDDHSGTGATGADSTYGMGQAASDFTGMTISEIVATYLAAGPRTSGNQRRTRRADIGNTSSTSTASTGATYTPGGTQGAGVAAAAAYAAGFRGEDLFKIVAIAGRESGFDAQAINRSSRDTGMWQIAPMNWGRYSQEDLLDPLNNAKIAFELYESSGFHGWKAAAHRTKNSNGHWVVDPSGQGGAGWAMNGDEMWHTDSHHDVAREAVNSVTASGDPVESVQYARMPKQGRAAPVNGGGSMSVTNQYHVDFHPEFKFDGVPQTPQLQKLAREAAVYLREQVDVVTRRGE